jgi:hypothetical protein
MTILNPAPVTANADRAGLPERTWPTWARSKAAATPPHSGGGPSRWCAVSTSAMTAHPDPTVLALMLLMPVRHGTLSWTMPRLGS